MPMHDLLTSRRTFLASGAALGGIAMLGLPGSLFAAEVNTIGLKSMTSDVTPIGREERAARLAKAQKLMAENNIGAILIEPGASLIYFTGVRWSRSERLTAAVIPASGPPIIVTPFFERPSVAESLGIEAEIRVWQEHESPHALVADFLKEKGLGRARIGIEETVRFFASDSLATLLPKARLVPANPVVRGCRMIKTPAEIALMQKASDVTIAAYRWLAPQIREGMTPSQIGALFSTAIIALGGRNPWALVLLGEASAYPHGTGKPQQVASGEVVLLDCGCQVEDYQSDISRSFVFGVPTAEQRKVWGEVAQGQKIAMENAVLGRPTGSVDDAVRRWYESLGYGPGYALPGLSHRTGHGIGMEGHEPVNLVHGETTKLAPGMCFSNEPGIYLPGKFGIRLEDCFYMTGSGPKYFSVPPPSIDDPFG